MPSHLRTQAQLTKVSIVVVSLNKRAIYCLHKFEEYFGSGLDAWETVIGRDVEQTWPKNVSKDI